MDLNYDKILKFMSEAGGRLVAKAGKVKDIGITKKDLTEEDLFIERGFKDIISNFPGKHILYAEEENNIFQKAENIWVCDPISGTANFIEGLPHYSIVISHLVDQQTKFAAVFDPAVNELFTAYLGKGAFLNNSPIKVSNSVKNIILRPSGAWKDPGMVEKVAQVLNGFEIENNGYSMAVNYCTVACGKFDGIVSFAKDTFPEFAGAFIVKEAGGKFTNLKGEQDIKESDRVFIGGNLNCYEKLYSLVSNQIK